MNAAIELQRCAEIEIVERHQFLVRWFSGQSRASEFAVCEQALEEAFSMVTPDGAFHRRANVIERLRAAHGSADAGFGISIEDIAPIWVAEAAILIGYVEAQTRDGRLARRRSTALLTRLASAPHGVAWRHLHETCM
jgi:hypothetical protein